MKIEPDNLSNKISILGLKETEYLIILKALKAAASDTGRKGIEYSSFYDATRGEVIAFSNKVSKEDGKLVPSS